MGEENVGSELTGEGTVPEKTTRFKVPGELTEDSKKRAERLIKAALEEAKQSTELFGHTAAAPEYGGKITEAGYVDYLVASTARPGLLTRAVNQMRRAGTINLTLSQEEFDALSVKSNEVLAEATLAQQRIAKDQDEIEQFKMETRAMLARLHAA